MPYNGPGPKPEDERVNRIPKRYEKVVIKKDADGEETLLGPDLPDRSPVDGSPWCPRTIEWWNEVWRRSPQAKLMTPTDWETMLEAAIIHNELWKPRSGRQLATTAVANYLSELRRRVGAFGATFEDRQKLQLTIQSPQTEEEGERRIKKEATAAVNYAERLLQYAADREKDKD